MATLTDAVLHAYAALWAERDRARRAALIALSLTEDADILGNGYRFVGHAQIDAEVERFHRHDVGARAVLASGVDAHHDVARFAVAVLDAGGKVVARGEDIVQLAADGRIRRVMTFWGELPPVPPAWPDELALR
jgi:hypothetical protein